MLLFVHFSTLSTFIVTTGWRVDDFPMTFTLLLLRCDRVSSLPEPSCMNLSYFQMCHFVPFGVCLPSLVSWQPILATITRFQWWHLPVMRNPFRRTTGCPWDHLLLGLCRWMTFTSKKPMGRKQFKLLRNTLDWTKLLSQAGLANYSKLTEILLFELDIKYLVAGFIHDHFSIMCVLRFKYDSR